MNAHATWIDLCVMIIVAAPAVIVAVSGLFWIWRKTHHGKKIDKQRTSTGAQLGEKARRRGSAKQAQIPPDWYRPPDV